MSPLYSKTALPFAIPPAEKPTTAIFSSPIPNSFDLLLTILIALAISIPDSLSV